MDISSIPAIDAAVGLFFFYFLLSLVCSAVNELIASGLNWRGKTLEAGLRKLLLAGDGTETAANNLHFGKFLENPRIARLFSPHGRRPSYIPSRTFALAVLDTLAPPTSANDSRDVLRRAKERADTLDGPIGGLLRGAVDEARGDRDKLRAALEGAFDDVMERASGWYKRKVQIMLLVIAFIVAGVANADTFAVGDRLLRDDALRAAVVAKATAVANAEKGNQPDPGGVANDVDNVKDLGIPLGWSKENEPSPTDTEHWAWKILGILLTVAALSLGAPFWFDLIGKVANVRGVGRREDVPGTHREGASTTA